LKETDNLENVLFEQSAKRLCADIVTLATIFELEIVEQITGLFGKILITESTWDTLLSYKQDVEAFSNDENKKVNNLLEFVRKYTEIRQPSILIELNGLDKDRSDDLLGRSFHETLLLAAEQKAILFTDDIAH